MSRVASLPVGAKTVQDLMPTLQRMLEELEALRNTVNTQQEQINELKKRTQESI